MCLSLTTRNIRLDQILLLPVDLICVSWATMQRGKRIGHQTCVWKGKVVGMVLHGVLSTKARCSADRTTRRSVCGISPAMLLTKTCRRHFRKSCDDLRWSMFVVHGGTDGVSIARRRRRGQHWQQQSDPLCCQPRALVWFRTLRGISNIQTSLHRWETIDCCVCGTHVLLQPTVTIPAHPAENEEV